uniref:SET domain-containing protein n=1 Tax=Candidatus Kentrum sp. LFY TaxID=2126342 RepID=A0A450WG89_9GAMM|nr:MAG: SET domain-containing protein [Candidatus Kentron sp. LFY]
MFPKTRIKIHTKPGIGKAVFAIVEVHTREKVIESRPIKTVPCPNGYSLELNGNHIIIDEPGVLVNHSCDPNCVIVPNAYGAFDFIACRKIQKDEEITFDYESNESEITAFSNCYCGAKNCRKTMNKNR